MNNNPILTIALFLAFIAAVWASIGDLEEGSVFFSFMLMLLAIYPLFLAYVYLSDSLEERLKVSQ
jgi:hypothetical protein